MFCPYVLSLCCVPMLCPFAVTCCLSFCSDLLHDQCCKRPSCWIGDKSISFPLGLHFNNAEILLLLSPIKPEVLLYNVHAYCSVILLCSYAINVVEGLRVALFIWELPWCSNGVTFMLPISLFLSLWSVHEGIEPENVLSFVIVLSNTDPYLIFFYCMMLKASLGQLRIDMFCWRWIHVQFVDFLISGLTWWSVDWLNKIGDGTR